VFQNLDLRLAPGQALWLRGPNGCGKTSLLRILAGLSRPEQGAVRLVDDHCRAAAGGGPRPGYVGHQNALKDELSVGEALAFVCSLGGPLPGRPELAGALSRFGLAPRIDLPVSTLSQGQRRKVALSRLWLQRRAIWLLDEPYDALDAAGIAVLDQALAEHLQGGGSLVLTSHQNVTLPEVQAFEMAPEAPR
jgi:heme exporter protein A